jgi:hypothetical protein
MSCSISLVTTPIKTTKPNIHFLYFYKDFYIWHLRTIPYIQQKPHRGTCAHSFEKYLNYQKMEMWQNIYCLKQRVQLENDTTYCQMKQHSYLARIIAKQCLVSLTTRHMKEITVSHIHLHVILQPYQEVCLYMLSNHCTNKTAICNTTPSQAQYILHISILKILCWPHHNALYSPYLQ